MNILKSRVACSKSFCSMSKRYISRVSPISEQKYVNRYRGVNSRLDTLQAAILLPKLRAFAAHEVDDVNRVAAAYTAALQNKVKTPTIPEGFLSSWAQYTLLLESREQRDRVQAALKSKGIPTMVYYPRGLHQQAAYKWMGLRDEAFPNTARATSCVLSLPMHPYMTDEEQKYIINSLLEVL